MNGAVVDARPGVIARASQTDLAGQAPENTMNILVQQSDSLIQRRIREDQRRRQQMADGSYYRRSRVMPAEGRGPASFQRECEQRARRLTRSLPIPTNSVQKLHTSGFEQYSQDYLHDTLGLFRRRDDRPSAKA